MKEENLKIYMPYTRVQKDGKVQPFKRIPNHLKLKIQNKKEEGVKQCSKCGETKKNEDFYLRASKKGRMQPCKECQSIKSKELWARKKRQAFYRY